MSAGWRAPPQRQGGGGSQRLADVPLLPRQDDLVQAVIDYQADAAVSNQRHADLGSVEGVQAWRDMVIYAAERVQAKGGCPLGSLGGQLAESDPEAGP